MKRNRSGPSVDATFFVVPQGIVSVKLKLLPPDQRFSWQFVEQASSKKIVNTVNDWVEAYCSCEKSLPKLPVVFDELPPYTRQVLENLLKLPFNARVTYQELAKITGKPLAARAVGNACGRNPCPLVVPCHHVFAANGLGGFSLGLDMKKALLAFEAS
jgi:methylated-DNA-[protein]-cysteine S-methyltransferase